MNLSTIAIALLVWQLLSRKDDVPFADMLNDDNKNLLDGIQKLTDKNADQSDKTGAILQLLTNPSIMNAAQNLFANSQEKPLVNSEGYNLGTPSKASKQFFQSVDKIADEEVKSKLYKWYDWYVK